jgi:hypothetical protein
MWYVYIVNKIISERYNYLCIPGNTTDSVFSSLINVSIVYSGPIFFFFGVIINERQFTKNIRTNQLSRWINRIIVYWIFQLDWILEIWCRLWSSETQSTPLMSRHNLIYISIVVLVSVKLRWFIPTELGSQNFGLTNFVEEHLCDREVSLIFWKWSSCRW